MFKKNQSIMAIIFFVFLSALSFWPVFLKGELPIPADILLGGFHPWNDLHWNNYSTIYPVLNPTISDTITSFYPWRFQAIPQLKNGQLPLIDQTTFMGNPLFETGTSGILYPLNLIFWLMPFTYAWSMLVICTPVLAGIFFYLWMKEKVDRLVAVAGGVAYGFSAFVGLQVSFVNTAHSVLWLPIILLSIDKLFEKVSLSYFIILVFGIFASINAGFFQGSLYILIFVLGYFIYRVLIDRVGSRKKILIVLGFVFPILLSAVQIIPFINLVSSSSRVVLYGKSAETSEIFNFFVQIKYFITTFFPDFFGNPGKWNYWGEPNYYEFNNFVGTLMVIGCLFLFSSWFQIKKQAFFVVVFLLSILLATPNFISQYPYLHKWPLISAMIPARILLISQFCSIVLGAFGLNLVVVKKISLKKLVALLIILTTGYLVVLTVSFLAKTGQVQLFNLDQSKWLVSFRNSLLPTATMIVFSLFLITYVKFRPKFILVILVLLSSLELVKQTSFFRPFIPEQLLFPQTRITTYLKENLGSDRYMIVGQDMFPANIQSVYGLSAVESYSPIFPERENLFLAAINSGDFSGQAHFSRTIHFENYSSPLLGLLNIKYVISDKQLPSPKLKFLFNEGNTYLYENLDVNSRAWLVSNTQSVNSSLEALYLIGRKDLDFEKNAVISEDKSFVPILTQPDGRVENLRVKNNEITMETSGGGFLVLSQQNLPGWQAYIDGQRSKVERTDFDLLGVQIPVGQHSIRFAYQPMSLKIGEIISVAALALFLGLTGIWILGRKVAKLKVR